MGIIQFIKNEPVLDAAVLTAATTIATSLAVRQGEVGVIAGAVALVLGAVARTQTYPSTKIKAAAALVPNIQIQPKPISMEDIAHGKLPDNNG